ncbi:MAG: hypothetical protein COZ11_06460 [Deltaproteobacteria bacterium CG_4_10_14_3_um_filter_51_14]|nr:MAG: hypothetical protein AUK25_03485 [Desulfobacteraceae bacterium CG2_30_51_40]PIY24969.1 MAG: hypothetical protein COZ11_06460 [Deltaproteobacteria bacterium CG_4_10_14_3_um_filter_51_14]
MGTIMPQGEAIRQAVKWISEMRSGEDIDQMMNLIDDASSRFNLSPKEEIFLRSYFSGCRGEPGSDLQ